MPATLHARRGMTLIELLVVVSIIVMLTAFALPVIVPSVEKQRIREAARMLNVYLGAARSRAQETGRPCGVIFQRIPGLNQAAWTLRQAEVPAPWAGNYEDSRVTITGTNSSWQRTVQFTRGEDPVTDQLVRVGDEIQLGYHGHLWRITAISGSTWTFSSMTATFPPETPSAVPFQIFRHPEASAVAPLQLPATIVVDLRWSGGSGSVLAADAFRPGNDSDTTFVAVMFSPRGDVDRVWLSSGDAIATEPIYFLIGKQQRVFPTLTGSTWDATSPAEDGLSNVRDLGNLWVTVNPQTGLIKTTQVATIGTAWTDSRRIARTGESMGGGG